MSVKNQRIGLQLVSITTLISFVSTSVAPSLAWAQEPERVAGVKHFADHVSSADPESQKDRAVHRNEASDESVAPQQLSDAAKQALQEDVATPSPSGRNNGTTAGEPVRTLDLPVGGDKSGLSSQSLALPGAASALGMGESFSTQDSTGVATFSLPFSLPAARGAAQPSLSLSYSSAAGMGLAGLGWSVDVPFIARQTDRGIPAYDDRAEWHANQDRFVFNGGQELVPICTVGVAPSLTCSGELSDEDMPSWSAGYQYFRARVEGSFNRFFWSPDHLTWRVQSKSGVTMELGMPLDGSKSMTAVELNPNPSKGPEIYRWRLVRQYDTYGAANPATGNPTPFNAVVYKYKQDAAEGQSYLTDIYDTTPAVAASVLTLTRYAHHTRLVWERRPDPSVSYRSGWPITQTQRLKRVDVTSKVYANGESGARRMVRRYHLAYHSSSHESLLRSVTREGRCGTSEATATAESAESLPESTACPRLSPMEFEYSSVKGFTTAGAATDAAASGFEPFDARIKRLSGAPPHSLDEDQADFFDINSDALPDVLVTATGLYGSGFGLFLSSGKGQPNTFAEPSNMTVGGVTGESASNVELRDANVLPLDIDGDGSINLLRLEAADSKYSVYSPKVTPAGWHWEGRRVAPSTGQNPKLTFGTGGLFGGETRSVDVNFDGLVDVVVSTGTELQTFLALGRLPGGDGQFGTGSWASAASAQLSTAPIRACLPAVGPGSLVRFSSPEYQFADMNADGIADIVRLYKGDIRYWPGRGNGFWGTGKRDDCAGGTIAERYQEMSGDEGVPDGPLRIDDVNGDGYADLVRLRFDGVDIWLNVDGSSWSARQTLDGTPANPAFAGRVRLVDINGSGTRDLVWGTSDDYQYMDLSGGSRPRLLTGIKNGLGKSTTIEYSTSTSEMLSAEKTGVACDALRKPWSSAWCTKMPIVTQVVKRVIESDNLSVGGSGPGSYVTEYSYRDPVFEGRQREFRGFGKVRTRRIGDANSPTDNTDNTFLLGECVDETVNNGVSECALPERWRDNPREALKGAAILRERYDDANRFMSTEAISYRLRQLYVGLDGRVVRHAFPARTRKTLYDTSSATTSAANDAVPAIVQLEASAPGPLADLEAVACVAAALPVGTVTTALSQTVPLRASAGYATTEAQLYYDAYGNSLVTVSRGCVAGSACPTAQAGMTTDEMLCSYTAPVRPPLDPTNWQFRTGLSWTRGSVHTEIRGKTRVSYSAEGAPLKTEAWVEGGVAMRRPPTGAATPSTASVNGAYAVLSENTYDALGNVIQERGAGGRCRALKYEAALGALSYAQLASLELHYRDGCPATVGEEVATALLNVATYDRAFGAVTSLTDMTLQRSVVSHDGFGRMVALTKPLPTGEVLTATTPATVKFSYDLPLAGSGRAYSVVRMDKQDGATPASTDYLTSYKFSDGMGRVRLTLNEADPVEDGHPFIVSDLVEFDAKGATRRKYIPCFNDSTPPDFPLPDAVPVCPSVRQRFDAFGRVLQQFDLDGTVTIQNRYHALSTDVFDAADLSTGVHRDTFVTSRVDGHGRKIAVTERVAVGTALELRETRTQYLATGQPEAISRVRGSDQVTRWMRYDSLGRLVLNVEPHTTSGFSAELNSDESTLKTWRYAYDDAGAMVASTDARGCGQNFYYDNLGRIKAEEYSPCETFHSAVTPVDAVTGSGFEVFYEYDEPGNASIIAPPAGYSQDPLLLRGKVRAIHDRASTTLFAYDARGRVVQTARKIARPGATPAAVAARYVDHWYQRDFQFDAADRPIAESSGATPDGPLAASDGESWVFTQYTRRGTIKQVSSSYGDLVEKITRLADGPVTDIYYGDAASTTTHSEYDARRRLASIQTYRGAVALWSATPAPISPPPVAAPSDPTRQLLLQDLDYQYDEVGNPTEIRDYRIADDWPAGAKPITRRSMQYDDAYRLTRVEYQYPAGSDSFVSPYEPELNGATDSRRPKAPGHKLLGTRPLWQSYSYDWLGNSTSTDDDKHAAYDRSLGLVTNDSTGKPYQLTGAAQVVAGGQHNGELVGVSYDAAGHLTGMQLIRSSTGCTTSCSSTFGYEWDEVGRLVKATRLDGVGAGATGPTVRYLYDAKDSRVLKQVTEGAAAPLTTAYVFESLELRRAAYDAVTSQYKIDATTEVPFLVTAGVPLARLHHEPVAKGEPRLTPAGLHAANLHLLLRLPDHLGSSSITIDHATGELVELRSYQPYGATESDYRPARWKGVRDDYGFTGKEEDVEVGLQYFGKRYLSPYLGRWVSPDPLAVHAPGSADLNLYAYVSGRVLQNTDPWGLESDAQGVRIGKTVTVDGFSGAPAPEGPGKKVWGSVIIQTGENEYEIYDQYYDADTHTYYDGEALLDPMTQKPVQAPAVDLTTTGAPAEDPKPALVKKPDGPVVGVNVSLGAAAGVGVSTSKGLVLHLDDLRLDKSFSTSAQDGQSLSLQGSLSLGYWKTASAYDDDNAVFLEGGAGLISFQDSVYLKGSQNKADVGFNDISFNKISGLEYSVNFGPDVSTLPVEAGYIWSGYTERTPIIGSGSDVAMDPEFKD